MNLSEKIIVKIKWLRTQPESVKIRYVWISAGIIFAIVVLLWIGLFRQYERKNSDNGINSEFIKAGEKLKNDIENNIKVPNMKLPSKEAPAVSPVISPLISLEASTIVSPEISPEFK